MLKYILLTISFIVINWVNSYTQDIPILSPFYTNSLIYNPAKATGSTIEYASVGILHKNSFSKVKGHPKSNIMYAYAPMPGKKAGLGLNIMYEQVNFFSSIYASLIYAKYFQFNNNSELSLGLSADIFDRNISYTSVLSEENSMYDPILMEYNQDESLKVDASFGLAYTNNFMEAGFSLKNLTSLGLISGKDYLLTNYYSAFLKFNIAVNGSKDKLQPLISYRKMPMTYANSQIDAGLIYTLNAKGHLGTIDNRSVSLGAYMGNNNKLGFLLGLSLIDRLNMSYTYELLKGYTSSIGSFHEISLSYKLLKMNSHERHSEYNKWQEQKNTFLRKIKK